MISTCFWLQFHGGIEPWKKIYTLEQFLEYFEKQDSGLNPSLLLNTTCPVLANGVDPGQLASEEANWSGSALFVIKYVNFYQKPGSSNLIGSKVEVGVA